MDKNKLKQILDDPYDYAKNETIEGLVNTLHTLSIWYYNTGKSLVSDEIYDILRNILEEKDSNNSFLKLVGAPIIKDIVKLPYFMPSLDKIKPNTDLLNKWLKQYGGPYIISDKLDGVSGLIYKTIDNKIKLFTRGNGSEGQDISHLIPYVLPKNILFDKMPKLAAVRGELIISKNNFKKISDKYKNGRNAVAGIVNSKNLSTRLDATKLIKFIAYALINPELKQLDQMKKIKEWNFPVVYNIFKDNLDNKMLSELLIDRRNNGEFEVDGIVVIDNSKIYNNANLNPEHGFAFKTVLTDQIAEAIIIDVLWDVSMHGYLKPRVQIEPINLVGVEIKYATAFNAKFIKDNVLGPGAVIEIVRSGDVIPYIRKIIKPSASGKPKMPTTPYNWNNTNIDIVVKDIHGDRKDRMIVKQITHFFKVLEIKFISEGIITKIVEEGYTSVMDIIKNKNELSKIDGIGTKLVNKIFKNIEEGFINVTVSQLMAATTLFGRGFGRRKTKLITDMYPNILNEKWTTIQMISKIEEIDGFNTLTATQFSNKFNNFVKFFDKLDKVISLEHLKKITKIQTVSLGNKFKDQKIVFSGTKNKKWEKIIENNGGKISTSVSSNTTILVYTDNTTSKYKKAIELGINIYTYDEFKKQFNL
jgi:DNA ligase (NAD+)